MGEHDFALELIDKDIARGMEDEPSDVLTPSTGWVGGYVNIRIGGEVPEGIRNEPLSVVREGAEEDVDVVAPLRKDDSADRLEDVFGRR